RQIIERNESADEYDRIVVKHVEHAHAQANLRSFRRGKDEYLDGIKHVLVRLGQPAIGSHRIRHLRLDEIKHTLDGPEVSVTERLGSLGNLGDCLRRGDGADVGKSETKVHES